VCLNEDAKPFASDVFALLILIVSFPWHRIVAEWSVLARVIWT
jgi:hypothetical protein